MPQWEVSWADGIGDDFDSEEEFLNIRGHVGRLELNPYSYSKSIKNMPPNLRRVRVGNFRLFILLEDTMHIVYCLSYLPRKNCYSKKSLNKVLTIVREISSK